LGGRLLVVHFTPPGVIGGVESIMEQHARLLAARGFEVEFVAGRRGRSNFPIHVIRDIDAARTASIRLEGELATGVVTAQFAALETRIGKMLLPLAEAADVVVVHNAFTLHFCLPLTAALWRLAESRKPGTVIAWSHDLSWTNPLYLPSMHPGYPWDLLRRPSPNTKYITVSHERKTELANLWGKSGAEISVVPNGIDPIRFLRLSTATSRIVQRYRLFDRDAVLLLPVRITRRKNIEAGIRAVRCLRDRGLDACFVVSGPVAPHHPARSMSYLAELQALRDELKMGDAVFFLADELGERLADRTVSELYVIADALLFPSAQEGFGLPILEAGLARSPAVLADIPIFREIGQADAVIFSHADSPATVAGNIIEALDSGPARLFRRVLREYRWDSIVDEQIVPLLTHVIGGTSHAR
jgi:mannosylglucosylglycerate synthase